MSPSLVALQIEINSGAIVVFFRKMEPRRPAMRHWRSIRYGMARGLWRARRKGVRRRMPFRTLSPMKNQTMPPDTSRTIVMSASPENLRTPRCRNRPQHDGRQQNLMDHVDPLPLVRLRDDLAAGRAVLFELTFERRVRMGVA